MTQEQNTNKERSSDRILVLKQKEGATPISTAGLIDHRIFKGENILHARMDPESCLWKMRYDKGSVPEPLRQSFTSFKLLRQHAERYFTARNIEIEEVKD